MSRQYSIETRIGLTRHKVWTFITNLGAIPGWNSDVSSVTQLDEGELGRGSVLCVGLKGRTVEVSVSYWEPETCFTLSYRSSRYLLETTVRMEDGLGATLLRVDSLLTPLGPWRLVAPFLSMPLRLAASRRADALKLSMESD